VFNRPDTAGPLAQNIPDVNLRLSVAAVLSNAVALVLSSHGAAVLIYPVLSSTAASVLSSLMAAALFSSALPSCVLVQSSGFCSVQSPG